MSAVKVLTEQMEWLRVRAQGLWAEGCTVHTFGCPSLSSLWNTWQNFQQSTALLDRGSRVTAAQKVWAPFS